MAELLNIKKFVYRESLIFQKVQRKMVLHLGCIGETDANAVIKLERAPYLLHHKVEKVAHEIYGIDLDSEAINLYTQKLGGKNLFVGDVEHLEKVNISKIFEIILFTDLIEHLSNPGLALEGIKRFISDKTEIIISVPHSFGLPNYIRYVLGRFKEGNQHVATYNSAHLENLLDRHGFKIVEIYSGFEKVSKGIRKIILLFPLFILKCFPKFGGTLIVIAKLKEDVK